MELSELYAQIEQQKNAIREACLRMGKAHYDAHKNDPPEEMEPDVKLVYDATEEILSRQAEIRELKGLVLCPECRKEISKDVVFCNFCGHRMKEPEPEPEPEPVPAPEPEPAPTPAVCDNCGKELRPGQKFCSGCGKPVAQMAAPTLEPEQKPRICANCGTPLPDGARFCFECGTPAG